MTKWQITITVEDDAAEKLEYKNIRELVYTEIGGLIYQVGGVRIESITEVNELI